VIKGIFKETVLLCARLGMVNLGHIALDGTKLKPAAPSTKAMSYGRMKQEEERLGKEIRRTDAAGRGGGRGGGQGIWR